MDFDYTEFLLSFTPISLVPTLTGVSYRLKHLAEKTAPNNYVANGSFIVGAILSNFRVKMDRPNAYFNMSEKSLKLKVEEIDRLKKTKQVISHVMQ